MPTKAKTPPEIPLLGYSPSVCLTPEQLEGLVHLYSGFSHFTFDCETIGTRESRAKGKDKPALDERTNRVLWIALAGPGTVDIIPMGHPSIEGHPAPEQLHRYEVLEALKPLFFSDKLKINHHIRFDLLSLSKYWGEIPPGPFVDTHTLVHLLNENLLNYDLGSLVQRYLSFSYRKMAKEGIPMDSFPFEAVAQYVGLDAKLDYLLYEILRPKIAKLEKIDKIFQLECDITEVLTHARHRGVMIDQEALKELDYYLREELDRVQKLIFESVGHEFLITSGPQKAKVLYEELGLPIKKRTKKAQAPSTDNKTLEALKTKHPVVPLMLEHSGYQKIASTYTTGFQAWIADDQRIRTGLKQSGTVTGRISSVEPNLQNVARAGEAKAAQVRSLFRAAPGYILVVGDYSQVEYRIMADQAGPYAGKTPTGQMKSKLLIAFNEGIDLHAMTGAGLVDKDIEDITKEERQDGKTTNFLLVFGGSVNKIMQAGLATKKDKAEQIYNAFHNTYPEIGRFSNAVVMDLGQMKHPYAETIWGRRRRLPDLLIPKYSADSWKRGEAERQAVNHKIQGTAADICKAAMVRAHRRIDRRGLIGKWFLILQVHDEIMLEVPEDKAEEGVELLREAMEGVKIKLRVPLVADIHYGQNWASAK